MKDCNYIVVNCSNQKQQHDTPDYTKGKQCDETSEDVSYYGYWDF